ncbi:hypothetical protein QIS74_03510 [Colletotrichum tabaci]|uniref:Uncharacterized protein n=1 Tax=Colletotrichum tabaci TaxID=1209068 RepID=A0AAV9TKG6_9PEZI
MSEDQVQNHPQNGATPANDVCVYCGGHGAHIETLTFYCSVQYVTNARTNAQNAASIAQGAVDLANSLGAQYERRLHEHAQADALVKQLQIALQLAIEKRNRSAEELRTTQSMIEFARNQSAYAKRAHERLHEHYERQAAKVKLPEAGASSSGPGEEGAGAPSGTGREDWAEENGEQEEQEEHEEEEPAAAGAGVHGVAEHRQPMARNGGRDAHDRVVIKPEEESRDETSLNAIAPHPGAPASRPPGAVPVAPETPRTSQMPQVMPMPQMPQMHPMMRMPQMANMTQLFPMNQMSPLPPQQQRPQMQQMQQMPQMPQMPHMRQMSHLPQSPLGAQMQQGAQTPHGAQMHQGAQMQYASTPTPMMMGNPMKTPHHPHHPQTTQTTQTAQVTQTTQTTQTAGWKKKKRNKNNKKWFNKKRHHPYKKEEQDDDASAAAKAPTAADDAVQENDTEDGHGGAQVENDAAAAAEGTSTATTATPGPEAGTWSGMFTSTLRRFV